MSLTVTKIRVYVSGGKVVRCDGNYKQKATDVRYVVIPASGYELKAVARNRAKTTTLARESGAEIAINFPYFNDSDGALLGTAIVDWKGTPLAYETTKTRGRAELYRDTNGNYGISEHPPAIVDWAVQGSPELLRNGAVVVAESHKRDQLSISLSDRSQRTAVGIRANGDAVLVVSDGRTSDDMGLTFEELALVFRDQLACVNAINGDGGGSSIMYNASAGGAINQSLNRSNERGTGCAIVAVKKAIVTPPASKTDELKVDLDAGHGLFTAGKRCPDDSMREFHFNSVVARYVAEELTGYTTSTGGKVSTRFVHDTTGTRDIPLSERVSFTNKLPADVLVSFHANAFGAGWNEANGIETYAAVVASPTSVKLAQAVQKALIAKTGRRDRGVKRADFTVIAKTTMPAILVEAGFMTNQEEAALLKTDSYRQKVALAIVEGLAEVYGLKRVTKPTVPTPEIPTVPITTREATLSSVNVVALGTNLSDGHITNGTTYVPVREIAEKFGAKVTWDAATRTVTITK